MQRRRTRRQLAGPGTLIETSQGMDGTRGSSLTVRVRASVYNSVLPSLTLNNWQSPPAPPVPGLPAHQSPHFCSSDASHVPSIPSIPYANTSSSHYLMSRPFRGPLSPSPKLHVTPPTTTLFLKKLLPSCDFTVQNPLMTTQGLLNTAQLSRTTFKFLFNLIPIFISKCLPQDSSVRIL